MKTRWFPALLALLLLLSPVVRAEADAPRTTVLIYMSGSDLESEDASASADLLEMVRAGVPADGPVRVLVQAGGATRWHAPGLTDRQANLLQVTDSGLRVLETQKGRDMGDPETLAAFLSYARENFPADRYLLVLWGHGDGPAGGVCFDDLFDGDSLTLDELAWALESASRAGLNIEAVVLDACMMNCADLLMHLGASTDYIVSSQESTLGSGGRYDLWLDALAAAPDMDTRALCETIAKTYIETADHGAFSQPATASVLDASQAGAVQSAVEALYVELDALLHTQSEELLAAARGLYSFGELDGNPPSGLVDALDLCGALQNLAPEECAALRAAVQRAVIFSADSGDLRDKTCGLSLFLPCDEQPWSSALDWYAPLADDSSYARLIVRLAEQLNQKTSVLGLLRGLFSGPETSAPSEPQVDVNHIWQGLVEAG